MDKINQLDSDGLRHGLHECYNIEGFKTFIGSFAHGKRHGLYTQFSGPDKTWEGCYIYDVRQGRFFVEMSGNSFCIVNFKDDLSEGERVVYEN
jgi:hypothetical protein